MDFLVLFVAVSIIYSALYFFDVIFKSCSHYPYIQFLNYTGFDIGFFRITWYTTSFNRSFHRWGSFRPKILQQWYTLGILCTVVLLPLSFYFLLQSIISQLSGGGPSEPKLEPIVVPVVPGVNLPLSDIGYYLVTLGITTILHEAGHVAAARREDITVAGVGFVFVFLLPSAFVRLGEQVNTLAPTRQLRIMCAGIWHNVVLAVLAYLVLIVLPFAFFPLYDIGRGVSVLHVKEGSPVGGPTGLLAGDNLVAINDCELSDAEGWQHCLHTAIRQLPPGYCVNEDLVHQLDESIPVKHIDGGLVECCSKVNDAHLCFEALEDETPLQILQYSCLPGRPVVAGTSYSCRRPRDCPPGLHCIRPVLANQTTLLRIQRLEKPVVIFVGQARHVLNHVKVSNYIPVTSLFGPGLPEAILKLCKYFVLFSSGLAVVNTVPCFYSDGNAIIYQLLRYIGGSRPRRQKIVGLGFNIAGSILLGADLMTILWGVMT